MPSRAKFPNRIQDGPFACIRPSEADAAKRLPIALYVHIPFCETMCPYCDFNTYAGIEPLIPAYVGALRREIALWGDALGRPAVGTVFFGGGTPSYLPSEDIGSVLERIHVAFNVSADAEVTVEANPGDLTERKLACYLELGADRLSIGVQSFDDGLLKVLGRRHSEEEAVQAFRMAVGAGFENVSIDLMYGIPHQSLDLWDETLQKAAEISPQHISMYCLTLEAGTPMEVAVRKGVTPEPDPDLAADMYLMAEQKMRPWGYRHYEISSWAKPDREGRHNLTYWRNQPYLGVGPGAHSYLASHRFHNVKSPNEYVRRLGDGADGAYVPGALGRQAIMDMPAVREAERIDRHMEMAETMMMGLHLDTGVGFEEFARRFGVGLEEVYTETVDELRFLGLLESGNGGVRLTSRGRLLGNEAFIRFLAIEKTKA